jgi:hypothetical protein
VALLDPDGKLAHVTWQTRAQVQKLARAAPDLTIRVRSARRSCREQYDLYGIGRRYNLSSAPVTYADGCRSWHVSGRAVDLDVLDPSSGRPVSSCDPYRRLGEIWEAWGGGWGGRWGGFGPCGDQGHFQWTEGLKMEDVCPDPGACEQVSALVDAQTVAPWHKRLPWLQTAAGAGVGLGLGLGVVLLVGGSRRRMRRS